MGNGSYLDSNPYDTEIENWPEHGFVKGGSHNALIVATV
jgi:hypothetical protein